LLGTDGIVAFLFSMLPIFELRGAIPWALRPGTTLSWQQAYAICVVGNMVPVPFLLMFLGAPCDFLRRNRHIDRFFEWLFERTRKRSKVVEKYEALGLALFVAIPLPVTGAWTGSVAAFVFGIRFWYAILAILCGVLIAGAIVTLATLGVVNLFFVQ